MAATIGKGILRAEAIDIQTLGAAMLGIVLWSTAAWYFGLPTSESLIAGLTGAGQAVASRILATLGEGAGDERGILDQREQLHPPLAPGTGAVVSGRWRR